MVEHLTGDVPERRGEEWHVRCPFHDDHEPSLRISDTKDVWFCDVCHIGGDVFSFVQRHRDVDFHGACRLLTVRMEGGDLGGDGPTEGEAIYPYHDETGNLLYEVVRQPPKRFRVRRPDSRGGYVWSMDGVRRVLYRLPSLKGVHSYRRRELDMLPPHRHHPGVNLNYIRVSCEGRDLCESLDARPRA